MTSTKKPRRGKGEGSITQRKDGRWQARITLDGKRRSFYGDTRKEAYTKMQAAQHASEQGTLAKGPKQTMKRFLEYWFEVHKVSLKLSTQALYKRHLRNHLIPAFGHIQLQKLTVDDVQAFCSKKVQEGLKPSTVGLLFSILDAALKAAVKWKWLVVNVCDAVTLPRVTKHEASVLSKEQAHRILEVAKDSRVDCLLVMALATGLRLGELLALHWSDVDLEKAMLQVRYTVDYVQGHGRVQSEPKSESGRRNILLPAFVVKALKAHRSRQLEDRLRAGVAWQEQDLVFANTIGGYLSRVTVYAAFKKVLSEVGLPPDMHFHDLRHNTATILLSMRVPAKVVQQILGHSAISTTLNIYAHVTLDMQQDAMDDMEGFFQGEG